MDITNILLIIGGAITILMGALGIGLKTRKAQRMVRMLGETGARIFYVIIGIALIVMAFVIDFGV